MLHIHHNIQGRAERQYTLGKCKREMVGVSFKILFFMILYALNYYKNDPLNNANQIGKESFGIHILHDLWINTMVWNHAFTVSC